MVTNKRQLSFYAEADVDMYLSLLSVGSKTAILNEAIRLKMATDAMIDLNDGRRPQYFAALTEREQMEVRSNMTLFELSANDVDPHVWAIVWETRSPNWKDNTRRYLTLHHAKYKEAFRIKKMRTQQEIDESMQKPAWPNKQAMDPLSEVIADFDGLGGGNLESVVRDFDGPEGGNLDSVRRDFEES